MSELKTNKVSPATGTALAIGDSGDTITVPSGATFTVDGTLTLSDGSITNAKLANMAANTVKVRDANSSGVPSDKALATTEILIGDGTGFTAAALSGDTTMTNAGAVTIANNAVNLAKLEDGTQGDILYYAASGAPTRLGFGTSGDFLKTQGTGANPVWAAPGGGGLIFISKNTLSSVVSTWDITDCFTSTYSKYLIQVSALQNDTENTHLMCTVGNSDLSSTSTWTYMSIALGANGTTQNNKTATGDGGFLLQWNLHNTLQGWCGNIWIFDPVGTRKTTSMGQAQAYVLYLLLVHGRNIPNL